MSPKHSFCESPRTEITVFDEIEAEFWVYLPHNGSPISPKAVTHKDLLIVSEPGSTPDPHSFTTCALAALALNPVAATIQATGQISSLQICFGPDI